MVKRTIEVCECDVCGKDAQRYTIGFPDGVLALDRCEEHARKLDALRNEPGSWTSSAAGRTGFKVSSPEEIKRQMRTNQRPR